MIKTILILLVPIFSFAGGLSVGDGGHVIICRTASGDQVSTLDLFEAGSYYNISSFSPLKPEPLFATTAAISYGNVPLDGKDYVTGSLAPIQTRVMKNFLAKIKQALPTETDFIAYLEKQLVIGSHFYFSGPISEKTMDQGQLLRPIPNNCFIDQVIVTERNYADLPRYLEVEQTYWESLSPQNQEALLLHEGLHDWFMKDSTAACSLYPKWFTTLPERELVIWFFGDQTYQDLNVSRIDGIISTKGAKLDNPSR